MLTESLRLDFAFVRLCDPDGGGVCEIARGDACPELLEWLHQYRADGGLLSRLVIVPSTGDSAPGRRAIVIPVGVNAEGGIVAAQSDGLDFPDDIDQLLLSVAAGYAVTAFRMARIVDDHQRAEAALHEIERQLRKARDDLETRVAERTAELRLSEAYLVQAQTLTRTGSWVWRRATNQMLYCSNELLNIFGLDTRQDVLSEEQFARRIHPDDLETFRERERQAASHKGDHTIHFRIIVPDGSVKYIEAIRRPVFDDGGELVELIGSAVDITERKKLDEEREKLRQLEAELAHMNRLTVMGELTASLAHEITQPAASARNNARAAIRFLETGQPDLAQEALRCVVDDIDRAADIVARIRDHIKKAPPRSALFDLSEAILQVSRLARGTIVEHGVLLQTHFTDEKCLIYGDRVQIQQVILNLILNAVEAMSAAEEAPRELLISLEPRQLDAILVGVHDTGPGIDHERRERIFEPFYTTRSNGVGMGLAICRSIIEVHGGNLWAEPNAPRGAVFRFTLPSEKRNS